MDGRHGGPGRPHTLLLLHPLGPLRELGSWVCAPSTSSACPVWLMRNGPEQLATQSANLTVASLHGCPWPPPSPRDTWEPPGWRPCLHLWGLEVRCDQTLSTRLLTSCFSFLEPAGLLTLSGS